MINRGNIIKFQGVHEEEVDFRLLRPHSITFSQVTTVGLLEMENRENISSFMQRRTRPMYERMKEHPNSLIEALSATSHFKRWLD